MTEYVHLAPAEAAARIQTELRTARECLGAGTQGPALDGYVRALGLALQLGPAPTEAVLAALMDAARDLAKRQQAEALATFGPSLVDLVERVVDAGALPSTPVMHAWAIFAADLCALIGQIGLALGIPVGHRKALLESAKARAQSLEESTAGILAVSMWIDELSQQAS